MGRKQVDFDDEDDVLSEMAEALDVDVEDLNIKEERGLSSFGEGTVYEITINGGGHKEWNVVADEDQMRELALAVVKQDLEQEPELFNKDFLEQHIDTDRLRRYLESDVMNMCIDDLNEMRPDDFWDEYERAGFDAPEEDEDGDRPDPDDSQIEELAEHQKEERLKDPMEYLEDIYGKEDAVKQAIEIAGIDIDEAAEAAVDEDGAEHFLCRYDGNYEETKGGFIFWRAN